jgi:cardiolipin synthase
MAPGDARRRDPRETGSAVAHQAFSRAAGAPLVEGNQLQLLIDARQNYPAWLDAIREARHHIYLESYIVYDDEIGAVFADALTAKAREGVRVRVIYDWMGNFMRGSRRYWSRLRAAGIEVRCYNPPRLLSPLGWIHREHRKTISVDGQIGVVAGLCIGRPWTGDPERHREPWRDTGVLIRGPAVAELDRAFADIWAEMGDPLPPEELTRSGDVAPRGTVPLRVIATAPSTAGLFRIDQLITELAQRRLWLADAYFVGTVAYLQALCSAAADGVDVRLLVPGASNRAFLKPLSRAGFRRLLRAGARVFEWNGPMMHAKTAVADGRWARVGSTNLNITGWFSNYELDVIAEDEGFAREMEQAYLQDLDHATELVLEGAGAVRIGAAVGAALTAKERTLAPVDVRVSLIAGAVLLASALLFVLFPRVLAVPVAVLLAWFAAALLYRGYREHRRERRAVRRLMTTSTAPIPPHGRSSPASR